MPSADLFIRFAALLRKFQESIDGISQRTALFMRKYNQTLTPY